MNYNIFVQHIG